MSQSVFSMLKDGQGYMNEWPMKKELYSYFPECRVVAATRFSIKVMPPAAVVTCAFMLNTMGVSHLPQIITIGAFFLSLPLQGLLWLGHRSNQQLPPALQHWYMEIHEKMRSHGVAVSSAESKPKYRALAKLLKSAFDNLDAAFTQRWFH